MRNYLLSLDETSSDIRDTLDRIDPQWFLRVHIDIQRECQFGLVKCLLFCGLVDTVTSNIKIAIDRLNVLASIDGGPQITLAEQLVYVNASDYEQGYHISKSYPLTIAPFTTSTIDVSATVEVIDAGVFDEPEWTDLTLDVLVFAATNHQP